MLEPRQNGDCEKCGGFQFHSSHCPRARNPKPTKVPAPWCQHTLNGIECGAHAAVRHPTSRAPLCIKHYPEPEGVRVKRRV